MILFSSLALPAGALVLLWAPGLWLHPPCIPGERDVDQWGAEAASQQLLRADCTCLFSALRPVTSPWQLGTGRGGSVHTAEAADTTYQASFVFSLLAHQRTVSGDLGTPRMLSARARGRSACTTVHCLHIPTPAPALTTAPCGPWPSAAPLFPAPALPSVKAAAVSNCLWTD